MTVLEDPPVVLPAPARPRPRRSTDARLWSWFTLPGTVWMALFFVSALLLILALSFGVTDDLGNPRFGDTLANWQALLDPAYFRVILRSFVFAAIASAICLVISYPVAYTIAIHGGRWKNALIAAIVIPFFANYLVRMYGWSTVLSDEGPVLTALRAIGLPDSVRILNTSVGVVLGLVYGFIVFMILPLYAALERMDVSLVEAGRDLYGGPLRTFFFVTVPATRAGALAGLVLVFLPATGDFVSAQLLGGPDQIMIGNLIQQKFFDGQNWPLGCALTVALMLVLLATMWPYLRHSRKAES
jgi:spermidine/putrescine transport system permease protein